MHYRLPVGHGHRRSSRWSGIVGDPRAAAVRVRGRRKVVALGASLLAMVGVDHHGVRSTRPTAPRFQFTQDYNWIKAFGAHYAVGVDGIALALILMTTILTPVCILASWHDVEARR